MRRYKAQNATDEQLQFILDRRELDQDYVLALFQQAFPDFARPHVFVRRFHSNPDLIDVVREQRRNAVIRRGTQFLRRIYRGGDLRISVGVA